MDYSVTIKYNCDTESLLVFQLLTAKRAGQIGNYELQGEERLGGVLAITRINEKVVDVSKCTIQWHRIAADGSKGGPITGKQTTRLDFFMKTRDLYRFVTKQDISELDL